MLSLKKSIAFIFLCQATTSEIPLINYENCLIKLRFARIDLKWIHRMWARKLPQFWFERIFMYSCSGQIYFFRRNWTNLYFVCWYSSTELNDDESDPIWAFRYFSGIYFKRTTNVDSEQWFIFELPMLTWGKLIPPHYDRETWLTWMCLAYGFLKFINQLNFPELFGVRSENDHH